MSVSVTPLLDCDIQLSDTEEGGELPGSTVSSIARRFRRRGPDNSNAAITYTTDDDDNFDTEISALPSFSSAPTVQRGATRRQQAAFSELIKDHDTNEKTGLISRPIFCQLLVLALTFGIGFFAGQNFGDLSSRVSSSVSLKTAALVTLTAVILATMAFYFARIIKRARMQTVQSGLASRAQARTQELVFNAEEQN